MLLIFLLCLINYKKEVHVIYNISMLLRRLMYGFSIEALQNGSFLKHFFAIFLPKFHFIIKTDIKVLSFL